MAKVDIAVITYNQQDFLEDCVESCLQQSYRDVAITIFDDASTDGTEEICRDLVEQWPGIRYVRNAENLGVARNARKAFLETDAPYFNLMLGDDRILPNFLAETVRGLDDNPDCVFAYGLAHRIVGDTLCSGMHTFLPLLPTGYHDLLNYLCFTNWIIPSFAVMRRSALHRTGHFDYHLRKDERGFLDHNLLAPLATLGPAYVLNKRIGYYRMHENSSTASIQKENRYKEQAVHVYDNIFHDIERYDNKTRYMAKANQIGRLLTANGIAQTALDMLRSFEIGSILKPIEADFLETIRSTLADFVFDSQETRARSFVLETPYNLARLAEHVERLKAGTGSAVDSQGTPQGVE